jgi:cellobiose-specific phosphotransferase system component IIB
MPAKRAGAKFCSPTCKNEYNYRNKDQSLKGTEIKPGDNDLSKSLKDVIKNEPGEDQQSQSNQLAFLNPEIEPSGLRNILMLNGDLFANDDQAEQARVKGPQQRGNLPIPPKYLKKVTKIKNFMHELGGLALDQSKKNKQALEQQYKELEERLKEQQERNGNEWVAIGGGTGAVIGFASPGENPESSEGDVTLFDKDGTEIPINPKKKKKGESRFIEKQEPSIGERIWGAAKGGTLGAILGLLVKKMTEAAREKSKQEQIAKIRQRMAELETKIKGAEENISVNTKLLGAAPEYETKVQMILNPEYKKTIAGLVMQQQKNKEEKPATKQPFKPKSDKIMSAKDVNNKSYAVLYFNGLWKEFFGMPSPNFCFLIHGNPGEGKSTFCMWLARYLAENFGRVLYVSGEEGLNSTFQDKLKFCKADVDDMHVLDVRTGDEFLKEVRPNEFHFIIFDSLHDMGIDAKKMKSIKERFKNTAFIGIGQNNKKEELWGTNEMKHLFDVIVNVKDYTAETTKNRFIEKGKSFKTADFMENDRPTTGQLKIISLKRDEGSPPLDADKWKIV